MKKRIPSDWLFEFPTLKARRLIGLAQTCDDRGITYDDMPRVRELWTELKKKEKEAKRAHS
jgi:hypothetical protein